MTISKRTLIRRHLTKAREDIYTQNDQFDMFSEKFFDNFEFIYVCSRFDFHCENSVMQLVCKKA